jgi:hypothetical protein
MTTLFPENQAHRATQREKAVWRPIYGSRLVPTYKETTVVITDGGKPQPTGFEKQFSHAPGALLIGPPKRTKGAGTTYIVWSDQSLRRVAAADFEALAKVPQGTRVATLKGGMLPPGLAEIVEQKEAQARKEAE